MKTFIFHRKDGWYPVELPDESHVAAHVACNPGTVKVVDMCDDNGGIVCWPKSEVERLRAEVAWLLRDARIPGCWECSSCNFVMSKTNLYVKSGTVGPDDSVFVEPCLNCGKAMQPLTLKKAYVRMVTTCEGQITAKEVMLLQRDQWKKVAEDLAISLREMHKHASEECWVYAEQDGKPVGSSFDLGEAYGDSEMYERSQAALDQFNKLYQLTIPTEPIPTHGCERTENPS